MSGKHTWKSIKESRVKEIVEHNGAVSAVPVTVELACLLAQAYLAHHGLFYALDGHILDLFLLPTKQNRLEEIAEDQMCLR